MGCVPLRTVLREVVGLTPEEYRIPKLLLCMDLRGDWVVSPDASVEDKMAGLGAILTDKFKLEAPLSFQNNGVGLWCMVSTTFRKLRTSAANQPVE